MPDQTLIFVELLKLAMELVPQPKMDLPDAWSDRHEARATRQSPSMALDSWVSTAFLISEDSGGHVKKLFMQGPQPRLAMVFESLPVLGTRRVRSPMA